MSKGLIKIQHVTIEIIITYLKHSNVRTVEEHKLIYLNGYFRAIQCLNSFTNDVLIAEITKHNYNQNISLEENLTNVYKTDKYIIQLTRDGNLPKTIKSLFSKYAERFISKIAQSRYYPFHELSQEEKDELINDVKKPIEEVDFSYSIYSLLSDIISEEDITYRVMINDSKGPFYALQHDTFIIHNNKRLLNLKLGIAD